jgi:hypothetical protein
VCVEGGAYAVDPRHWTSSVALESASEFGKEGRLPWCEWHGKRPTVPDHKLGMWEWVARVSSSNCYMKGMSKGCGRAM